MTVVSIHQPNFFPWLGYFSKITESDCFIFLDNVQYVKGTVANQNKILSRKGEVLSIRVPVLTGKGHTQKYNEISPNYSEKWVVRLRGQLKTFYGKTAYFSDVMPDVNSLLGQEYKSLAELNINIIKFICMKANIETKLYQASQLEVDFNNANSRNIGLVKAVGGTCYLSGVGAKAYNDAIAYEENNIDLNYSNYRPILYRPELKKYDINFSVLDFLFHNGYDAMKDVLEHG